ncbi:[acyl-carrier-protein] S-malonyltransferase [Rubritalea squalenifaciens DSM 18772]|uniref:Malonyl CoA-acyl carrier protein transacylase n=1 Tax=Rubritalea squalenifaciens DSM 18772 TaxID=1123071 RepID=A0A1M6GZC9_9BACT|nr:ACP S-malonyltransferase [Rubritalea squalenifaciens]SHJ15276.1 [acyl-carrier-protein] S-malonyltransferase [Rubritalea squalenifaciens DSM 18772]
MSKKVVILFSGQGAQKVGMGKDLVEAYSVAKELFSKADEALGFSLSEIMFDGPDEELTKTSRCQPALYLHGLACLAVLKEKVADLKVTAAAGLSLGEFTAHAAAGTFSFEDGLNVVAQRGQFMEEACESTEGSMAAMIGGDEEAVKQLAADSDVDVANFNAPGQIVLSGTVEGIDKAVAGAKERGIRMAKKLNVAGAYHSRLMQSAQDKLSAVLADTEIATPNVPVYCNFKATQVADAAEIRETLEKQVTGSVRWTESMQALIAEGNTTFVELGPGKVLAGLMGRIDKSVEVISIEDAASLEEAIQKLA